MRLFFIIIFLGILNSYTSFAGFTFSPVIAELAPSGAKSTMAFTVRNQTEERTPVMISIVHREPGLDGIEVYKETPDIDDLFQIYPSQLILGPNDLRTVRVAWIGEPKLAAERAFRIIAEELPFSLESEAKSDKKVRGEIKIATKYVGSLYVTPDGAAPALEITAKIPDPELKEQAGKLQFDIKNVGTKHTMMSGIKLKVVSAKDGNPVQIADESIQKETKENILAGKTRRIFVPVLSRIPNDPLKVTFEFPKTK